MLGIVVLAMAIYIRAEWTLKHYIIEMEAYFFWTGPYILMASSSLTIFLSFFGCWATVYENPFLLTLVYYSESLQYSQGIIDWTCCIIILLAGEGEVMESLYCNGQCFIFYRSRIVNIDLVQKYISRLYIMYI